jgi:hypothetical protein
MKEVKLPQPTKKKNSGKTQRLAWEGRDKGAEPN